MTDAYLMDADCIHGRPWYECDECFVDAEHLMDAPSDEPEPEPEPGDEF